MENDTSAPINSFNFESIAPSSQNIDIPRINNEHAMFVEKFDPNSVGQINYLLGKIPSIFPELQITPNEARDSFRWIPKQRLVDELAQTHLSDTQKNSTLLNRLEELTVIEGRINGNKAETIYSLVDTIIASYALKTYDTTDELLQVPSNFWESLRFLVDSGVKERRSEIIAQAKAAKTKQFNKKVTDRGSSLKLIRGQHVQKP